MTSKDTIRYGFNQAYWSICRFWMLERGYSEEMVSAWTGEEDATFSLRRFTKRIERMFDAASFQQFKLHLRRQRSLFIDGIYTGAGIVAHETFEGDASEYGDYILDTADKAVDQAEKFKGGQLS